MRRCACLLSAAFHFPASSPPSPPPCFLSGAGGEQTAADVHATLRALVTTEAAQHSAWAEYAAVLLDEETASFFAARLTEGKGVTDGDEPNLPSKKIEAEEAEAADRQRKDCRCRQCRRSGNHAPRGLLGWLLAGPEGAAAGAGARGEAGDRPGAAAAFEGVLAE